MPEEGETLMKEKILIVDDEENIRFTFTSFLHEAGYQVETADSLSNGIKKMQAESFDLLFLDIGLGVDNGIEAIEGIKVLQPDCSVVIMTGSLNTKAIVQARQYGALDYVVKPVRQQSLLYLVQKTLGHKEAVNQ